MIKVLVVDDEYAFADYAKLILESMGYSAVICLVAARAVEMAVAHRPDIIITDLNMDLDGLELIDRLKARPETKDIPILLASSSTDRADRAEALRRGAMYSIVKPLQKDVLKMLIDKLVPKPAQ